MDSSTHRQAYDIHRRLNFLKEKAQISKKDFEEKIGQLNLISMETDGETVGQWIEKEMRFSDTIPYFVEKKKYTRGWSKWLSKGSYGARISLDEKTIENPTTRGIDIYMNGGGWHWKKEDVMNLPDIHNDGFLANRSEAWGVGRLGIKYSRHINGKWHTQDYLNLLSHGHEQLFSPRFISNNELVFYLSGSENILNYCTLDPELIVKNQEPEIKPIFNIGDGSIKDVRVLPSGLAIYHNDGRSENVLTFTDREGKVLDKALIAEKFQSHDIRVDSDNRFFYIYTASDGSIIYEMNKSNDGLWQKNKIWMSPIEIHDYKILPNQKIALVCGPYKEKEFGILDLKKLDTALEYEQIDKLETRILTLQPLPNGRIYAIDSDNNQIIKYDGEVVDE